MVSLKEARHHSLQRAPRDSEIQSMAGQCGDRKIFWRSRPNCAEFVEQAAGQVHEHAVDFCKPNFTQMQIHKVRRCLPRSTGSARTRRPGDFRVSLWIELCLGTVLPIF